MNNAGRFIAYFEEMVEFLHLILGQEMRVESPTTQQNQDGNGGIN